MQKHERLQGGNYWGYTSLNNLFERNNLSHQKSANRRLDREIITHNTDEDVDFNEEFIHKSAVKDRIQANNRETDREI